MSLIKVKRAQIALDSVSNAKAKMELKELEMLEEIERIHTNMDIQDEKIKELKTILKTLKEE